MMYLIAFILCFIASLLFCLSMPKHYRQLLSRNGPQKFTANLMRLAAYTLCILAVYFCVKVTTVGIAITAVFGILTVTFLLIAIPLGLKVASGKA